MVKGEQKQDDLMKDPGTRGLTRLNARVCRAAELHVCASALLCFTLLTGVFGGFILIPAPREGACEGGVPCTDPDFDINQVEGPSRRTGAAKGHVRTSHDEGCCCQ